MRAPRLLGGAALVVLLSLFALSELDSSGVLEARATAETAAPALAGGRLRALPLERVCTTLGETKAVQGKLFRVDSPKLRATIAGSTGNALALTFFILGATSETAPLRSGELRNQLGLELLARDTCNLLYVMWRQEPRSELVVSVKRNVGQSTHAECENRGYHRLRPSRSAPVPRLEPGKRYSLSASIEQGALDVWLDGTSLWHGALDAAALELSGRAGLRSDNLRFDVETLAAELTGGVVGACAH
jgi:hypothetical protein